MSYSLNFLPEVEHDAIAAYLWYENKAHGLGEEFLRLFYACSNEITRNPLLYMCVYDDFHRRLLRRFPYAIYFRIEHENAVIFGLFHCARDPQFIKDSLDERRS
jgi:hypothetical protein